MTSNYSEGTQELKNLLEFTLCKIQGCISTNYGANEMGFPGNTWLIWKEPINQASIKKDKDYRNRQRLKVFFKKSIKNQKKSNPIYQPASTDMQGWPGKDPNKYIG